MAQANQKSVLCTRTSPIGDLDPARLIICPQSLESQTPLEGSIQGFRGKAKQNKILPPVVAVMWLRNCMKSVIWQARSRVTINSGRNPLSATANKHPHLEIGSRLRDWALRRRQALATASSHYDTNARTSIIARQCSDKLLSQSLYWLERETIDTPVDAEISPSPKYFEHRSLYSLQSAGCTTSNELSVKTLITTDGYRQNYIYTFIHEIMKASNFRRLRRYSMAGSLEASTQNSELSTQQYLNWTSCATLFYAMLLLN